MSIPITEHPAWVQDLFHCTKPYRERIESHPYFLDAAAGTLTLERIQAALVNFFPLVESFPKYMALNLAKVPPGDAGSNRTARRWLIANINVERAHSDWWKQWAAGFGVSREVFDVEIRPPAEIDAINSYLWRVCHQGSLAEGMAATNYAVEGPTGHWTKNVKDGLRKYHGVYGVEVDERTLRWIDSHADYDDLHPHEALEIIKGAATEREEQERVTYAARRAMEYYVMALDACYERF